MCYKMIVTTIRHKAGEKQLSVLVPEDYLRKRAWPAAAQRAATWAGTATTCLALGWSLLLQPLVLNQGTFQKVPRSAWKQSLTIAQQLPFPPRLKPLCLLCIFILCPKIWLQALFRGTAHSSWLSLQLVEALILQVPAMAPCARVQPAQPPPGPAVTTLLLSGML